METFINKLAIEKILKKLSCLAAESDDSLIRNLSQVTIGQILLKHPELLTDELMDILIDALDGNSILVANKAVYIIAQIGAIVQSSENNNCDIE